MRFLIPRLWRRLNHFSTYFMITGLLLNYIIGYFVLSDASTQGRLSGRLEIELKTEGASIFSALATMLGAMVFVRSSLEALDAKELNRTFSEQSISLLDTLVFDGFLMIGLNMPIAGLALGGSKKLCLYILFDSSEVFTICAGLFLFMALRREARSTLFHLVFVLLFAAQILFYLGLSNDPTPLQQRLTLASDVIHTLGVASIPFFNYVVDYKQAYRSYKSGRLFMFNTSDNVKLGFCVFHILVFLMHWGVVLFSDSKQHYLDWTCEIMYLFFLPFIAVALGVLVSPKRLDKRMRRLLETTIIQRSNKSAELVSLTRKLEKERRKHRELLEQMLPTRVIEELEMNGKVASEHFDSCTIFFSDIEGYTEISSKVDTAQVVFMLNQLYTVFDNIVGRDKRLYKVETIGDAYMVSSGAPTYVEHDEDHAAAIADMSILLHEAVKGIPNPLDPSKHLNIRVGIHSGSVLGTVMGTRMPRYTLVGDTVNMASRMESTGMAGRTQVSPITAELLRRTGKYILEERGEVNVKGKGILTTHWLVSATESHEYLNESYIAMMRKVLNPQKTLGLRRQQTLLQMASISSVNLSNRALHVSLQSTCPDRLYMMGKIKDLGYECTLNRPSQPDDEIILVDLDADQTDFMTDLPITFRGLLVIIKSLEVAIEEAASETVVKASSSAGNGATPLLLYKPFDPEAFHSIVRNFYPSYQVAL